MDCLFIITLDFIKGQDKDKLKEQLESHLEEFINLFLDWKPNLKLGCGLPLNYAVYHGQVKVAKILLENEADPNHANEDKKKIRLCPFCL